MENNNTCQDVIKFRCFTNMVNNYFIEYKHYNVLNYSFIIKIFYETNQ